TRARGRDHLEVGPLHRDVEILDAGGHADLHATRAAEAAPQRRADHSVGDDVTERIDPVLVGPQARESEPPCIGDVDGADRRGFTRHLIPDAQALEYSTARIAERCRALIEARLCGGVGRDTLDEQHPHAGAGEAQREARPYHAAAHDGDIEVAHGGFPGRRLAHRDPLRAAVINLSIASTSLGAPSVSTSTPRLVTTTSSSIRTPMRCRRFGTPRAPAGMYMPGSMVSAMPGSSTRHSSPIL